MLRFAGLFIFCALSAARGASGTTALPGLVRTPLSIPITLADGRPTTLEGLATRPDRAGRLPLVVLVHGSPNSAPGNFLEAYRRLSPTGLAGAALAFAQHGYAAVSIARRGFGRSDGPYAEFIGDPCDDTDYLRVGLISAEDVTGAVASLRREPWVDPDRVLMVGNSTGGFATVAAGAGNPPGVVGAINIAGGRGAFVPGSGQVCSSTRLVDAFATFGRTARVPVLWLYTENDQSFSPIFARRMFDAYTASGAPAQLEMLPPFGRDGHVLLTAGSQELWWPPIERFLASLQLPTSMEVPLPPSAPIAPPPVNGACGALFRDYVAARTDAKAFAVNPEGHCGFDVTARSLEDAEAEAMARCSARWADCRLYAAGQQLVGGAN